MWKCSQIEHISTKFHKHSTTNLHFILYRLLYLLFLFKFWYTHIYRVFISTLGYGSPTCYSQTRSAQKGQVTDSILDMVQDDKTPLRSQHNTWPGPCHAEAQWPPRHLGLRKGTLPNGSRQPAGKLRLHHVASLPPTGSDDTISPYGCIRALGPLKRPLNP